MDSKSALMASDWRVPIRREQRISVAAELLARTCPRGPSSRALSASSRPKWHERRSRLSGRVLEATPETLRPILVNV